MESQPTFLPIKLAMENFTPAEIPTKAGVYIFWDRNSKALYVGKATSLRHRLSSYFQAESRHEPRINLMLRRAKSVEYILTDGTTAALILENNLIKAYRPPFNVVLRDDKTYPYLRITAEPFPRILICRRTIRDGSRYLGPFSNALSLRKTLHHLSGIIPLRSCKRALEPDSHAKPCLNYQINLCLSPCSGKITTDDYALLLDELISFLLGKRKVALKNLEERMNQAALHERFEEAAHWRDRLWAAQRSTEAIPRVEGIGGALNINADVIGAVGGIKEGAVALLVIREGRMLRVEKYIVLGGGEQTSELVASFIGQHYGEETDIPPLILLPPIDEEKTLLAEWLEQQAHHKVELRNPRRGVFWKLLKQAQDNAQEHLATESTQERERLAALERIQEWLMLPEVPHRIEAVDISNLGEKVMVASSSCLIDGKPAKTEYRHYRIKTLESPDDCASITEVVSRRLMADRPTPDLLLIDGGKGQLSAAVEAIYNSKHPQTPVVALSKGVTESLWSPRSAEPLPLPADNLAARLLRLARDEAHRFAISYNRKKARGGLAQSLLDGIPGLGKVRRHILFKTYPNPRDILNASIAELAKIQGIGRKFAESLYASLHP